MAVVLAYRGRPARRGPLVAGIPTSLRSRTHLPVMRTDPRLDDRPHGYAAPPGRTAGPWRLHPAVSHPPPGQRRALLLGTARTTWSAHSRPRPPRVPQHPPENRPPGQRTESQPSRPRTTRRQPNRQRATHRPIEKIRKASTTAQIESQAAQSNRLIHLRDQQEARLLRCQQHVVLTVSRPSDPATFMITLSERLNRSNRQQIEALGPTGK